MYFGVLAAKDPKASKIYNMQPKTGRKNSQESVNTKFRKEEEMKNISKTTNKQ